MDDYTPIKIDCRMPLIVLAQIFASVGWHIVSRDGELVAEKAPDWKGLVE